MTHFSEMVPTILAIALVWFVIRGTRELFREASMAVVRKSTS